MTKQIFRKKLFVRGRNPGGKITLYRAYISSSISVSDSTSENILQVKIKGSNGNNLYTAAAYHSPEAPVCVNPKGIYDKLQNKLLIFAPNHYILIGGNFNSRTGKLQ